jgi:hypothetical protein
MKVPREAVQSLDPEVPGDYGVVAITALMREATPRASPATPRATRTPTPTCRARPSFALLSHLPMPASVGDAPKLTSLPRSKPMFGPDPVLTPALRDAVYSIPAREVAAGLLGSTDTLGGVPLTDDLATALRRLLQQSTGSDAIGPDLLRDIRPFGEVLEVSALCAAQRRIPVTVPVTALDAATA